MNAIESFRPSAGLLATLPALLDPGDVEKISAAVRSRLNAAEPIVVHTPDTDDPADGLALMYEPRGRAEGLAGPELDRQIDEIVMRRLKEENAWLPDSFSLSPWFMFAYEAGQYIIPHADGSDYTEPDRKQLAAISITLEKAEAGGEFFVSLAPFTNDWSLGGHKRVRTGLDPTSSSYDFSQWPRWIVDNQAPGGAVIFGSEIVHGTLPVTTGRALKILSFVTVEEKEFFATR